MTPSISTHAIPSFEELFDLSEIQEIQDSFALALGEVPGMSPERRGNVSNALFLISRQVSEQACRRTMNTRQSQKMEAIGALAGGIAHDFNNILFPVIGFSEMVMEDLPKDSPLQSPMKAVLNGAFRARDLVQQILTFSRETEQARHPLKIQLILKEVLKLSRASLPSTIKIRSDISDTVSMVMADPSQIHQVVMNLIINALHAMEENGGELRVSLSETAVGKDGLYSSGMPPGVYVCLKISDTGTGMDEDTRKRIFEPYFTTQIKGKTKGTGLGLAVVHGIVKKLQGEIVVHSEVGKGTEFIIYLPRIKPAETAKRTLSLSADPKPRNQKILLVDDEEFVLRTLGRILSRMGYAVTCQSESPKALERFQEAPQSFDLVITDMTMPDLTGDKLISEIKKIRPDIPVMLCSGFNEKILNEKAQGTKPDKILMKPVTKNELMEALEFLLDK